MRRPATPPGSHVPPPSREGFTVIEVLIAVVVLGIGVVALVGSSAATTRMIGRGRTATVAVQAATQRMELLRTTAYRTTPDCTALANDVDSTSTRGVTTAWTVTASGNMRTLRVVSSHRVPGRTRADTLLTQLRCN